MSSQVLDADLKQLVTRLSAKVDRLEKRLAEVEKRRQPTEDELIAIAAAVAAYLGYTGPIRSVRRVASGSWSREARVAVHNRTVQRTRTNSYSNAKGLK